VIGHELAVEEVEAADPQARDQPGERNLGGVGRRGEHALAEEGAGEAHAIEAADQLRPLPHLDRVGAATGVEVAVALLDRGVGGA
jgi:hypothetical protein